MPLIVDVPDLGDALHRRPDRQLHHRHARADQRAGGGGRAGHPRRMARQPARPRGRGRGAAPVGAGRRQGQPHAAHDVHGGHDARQRALVVGADLPQRRHGRLALQPGPPGPRADTHARRGTAARPRTLTAHGGALRERHPRAAPLAAKNTHVHRSPLTARACGERTHRPRPSRLATYHDARTRSASR